MFPIYCYRCGDRRDSLDGSCCLYCNNDNSVIPSFSGNLQPTVSESANVNPGEPASDTIIRMTDVDLSFLDEIGGDGSYLQVSDQEAPANRNLLPENPNINKDNIYYRNIGRCNLASIGPSLASMTDSHVVPEQPPSNERQCIDEEGKLDFAGSIDFQSEHSIPNSNPESFVNVNSSIVLARKNSGRFPRNMATSKSDLEHEVHYSGKARRSLQISFSRDGVRCCHCDHDEASRTLIAGNFPSPVSEPRNVSPGYYVPASDASTRTTEDDFLLLEPTRDASSQTTESNFSLLAEINACHGQMGGSNYICSSQVFHQDSSQHNNPCSKIFSRHLLPNDMEMVPTHDKKRKDEKDQMISDISEGHFEASKVKRMRHVDVIHAVPGPSGFHQNKDTSTLSAEKSQSGSSLEPQSVALTDEKTWICDICQWDIGAHFNAHEGKMFYKCCACDYESSSKCELQKHLSIHRPNYSRCNICGEFDFQKDAHGSEKWCDLCNEKFPCRTLLEKHSLVHEDYYRLNCRLCGYKINYHIVFRQEKRFYKCCGCQYEPELRGILRSHLYIHTDLRLFKCEVCGRRSKQRCSRSSHVRTHFKCKRCDDLFTSIERLEEHYIQIHTRA